MPQSTIASQQCFSQGPAAHNPAPLVSLLLVLFLGLAAIVTRTSLLSSIDASIAAKLQRFAQDLPASVMDFAALLGSPAIKTVTLIVAFFILDLETALLGIFTIGGSAIQVPVLQVLFHRPRPPILGIPANVITPYGFPSGHAMGAIVFYGFIGYLVTQRSRRISVKVASLVLITAIISVVGMQRIVLGVHWPTDVIGGYMYGGAWLTLIILYVEPHWHQFYLRMRKG